MSNKTSSLSPLPISPTSFDTLKSTIKGDIILPFDPAYAESIVRWCASSEKKAGIVVYPKDDEDILRVLEVAVRENVDLAVKGGGHSFSNAASSEGGIVLDLNRYMHKVTVDPENKTVTAQAGARWVDVDNEAVKYDLACVGATINDTGVAGLTLGGGYGFLSGRYGLVIDNLLSATIITGKLERLVVSSTSNADLFNALRGGGSNFGVVTSFTYRAHEQKNKIWIGVVKIPFPTKEENKKEGESHAGMLMQAIQKWYEENGDTNTDASCMLFCGWPLGELNIQLIMFYNGEAADAEGCFKVIWDLPCISTFKQGIVAPYPTVNSTVVQYGLSCYAETHVVPAVPTGLRWISLCDRLTEIHTTSIYTHTLLFFEFIPSHKLLNAAGKEDMAFTGRHEYINVMTLVAWQSKAEADNEKAVQEVRDAREVLATLTSTGGFSVGEIGKAPVYANLFTDVEGVDRSKKLYGTKYSQLQQVKAKYDPNEVFNKWFPIKPTGKAE